MGTSKPDLMYQPSGGRTGRPRKLVVDGKQQCSTCREWKPLENFYPAKHTFNRRETRCDICTLTRTRNFYNNDVERYIDCLCKAHKSQAKTRRMTPRRKRLHSESELTTKSVIELWHRQDGKCAITGLPMTHLRGAGHYVLTNISFDRIDSNLGYTLDNVRLVCKAVNVMKYVLTDKQLLEWASLILNGPLANRDTVGTMPTP